jgi:DNA polymerase-3 subunit chi
VQVDFYQLSRDPVERAVAKLAAATLAAGERLLVVHGEAARFDGIAQALWGYRSDAFLANGVAGGAHDARQPVLLATTTEPVNGARFVALADGLWREDVLDGRFERVLLVFGEATVEAVRATWRALGKADGISRRFWKQEQGGWVQAG